MTPERVQQIIDQMSDDDLIAFATKCSNRGISLSAEMQLRARYPSSVTIDRGIVAQPERAADS